MTPKKGAIKPPVLAGASVEKLLEALKAPERWTRLKAKQVLVDHKATVVRDAVRQWSANLQGRENGLHLLEAVSALEWIEQPDALVLKRVRVSSDQRARAYGARVAGRWSDRV